MHADTFSYEPRPIRFLGLWKIEKWQMKAYGIAFQREKPQPKLIAAAKEIARDRLSQVSATLEHYRVGFIGIHEGKTANFVFVDWWADENELHNHVYVSSPDDPVNYTYKTPMGMLGYVWNLRIMFHERQAWINTVLKNETGADIEAYLEQTLNEDT